MSDKDGRLDQSRDWQLIGCGVNERARRDKEKWELGSRNGRKMVVNVMGSGIGERVVIGR